MDVFELDQRRTMRNGLAAAPRLFKSVREGTGRLQFLYSRDIMDGAVADGCTSDENGEGKEPEKAWV